MHMLEFKKVTDFPRGTLYNILCDAYSYDDRNKRIWDGNWKETDDFFYDNPEIVDKYGLVTCLDGEPIGFITWDPRNCPEYVEIGHNGIREKYKIQEYITIIPTPEFQITHYKEREYVPYVLEGCSDKQKAFDNWMQRDILFAEYVRSECEKNDIPCIINDGLISKDEMFEKVKKKVNINQYNTQTKMKIMGQTDKQSVQQHPFPPLYDKDSKVLILGSFPSVKSREMKFFYGHPQNRFWKVIACIFDQENPTSIEEKKKLILDNHLALWDVIAECEISGSSDASIKNAKANDLSEIIKNSKIQKIIVNGKTAERLYIKYIEPVTGIKAVVLPSTSPANAAWSLERLVDVWKSEIKN